MRTFAAYRPDGTCAGFYHDELHSTIPEPNIELTYDQWQTWCSNPHLYKVVGGNLVPGDPPPPPTYVDLRRGIHGDGYPPYTDFLDAWVKNDQVALEAYRQACLAVKAKYPKPPVA